MTKFIEFDVYEQYLKDNKAAGESIGQFMEREAAAVQTLADLKAEYEQTIKDNIGSGEDITAKLDALDGKIADAERAVSRRKQELALARTAKPSEERTKRTDVVAAQRAYAEEVGKAHVDPFIAKMRQAADLIIEASNDYRTADHEYGAYFDEIKEVHVAAHKQKETPHLVYPLDPFTRTSVQREITRIVERLNAEGVELR